MKLRYLITCVLALALASSTPAQMTNTKGTTQSSWKIGTGANQLSLTNSSGALSLTNGLTVSGGTVNFTGASLTLSSINNTPIGNSTPSTGGFTSITVTSGAVVTNLNAEKFNGKTMESSYTVGGIMFMSTGGLLADNGGPGSSGQFLISNGGGAPVWKSLSSSNIFVGDSGGIPRDVALSGDATLSNTGVMTIAGSAVTAAKLADAVADYIPKVTLSAGAEGSDTIAVTVQLKDIQGNNLSTNAVLEWVISDSATSAAATAESPTVAYTTGEQWSVITANKRESGMTNTSGVLVLGVTLTGAHTIYLLVKCGAIVANVTLTFAA